MNITCSIKFTCVGYSGNYFYILVYMYMITDIWWIGFFESASELFTYIVTYIVRWMARYEEQCLYIINMLSCKRIVPCTCVIQNTITSSTLCMPFNPLYKDFWILFFPILKCRMTLFETKSCNWMACNSSSNFSEKPKNFR